jgi:hypothetical protein
VAETGAYNRAAGPATTVAALRAAEGPGHYGPLPSRWFKARAGQHDVVAAVISALPRAAEGLSVDIDDRVMWERLLASDLADDRKLRVLRTAILKQKPAELPGWLAAALPLGGLPDVAAQVTYPGPAT